MKKIFVLSALAIFCGCGQLFAQNRFSLKVNAGGNATTINNMYSHSILQENIVPGLNVIGNAKYPPNHSMVYNEKVDNIVPGYFAEAELFYHLNNDWALSISSGINKVNSTYNVVFPPQNKELNEYVKNNVDINKMIGKISSLYFSTKPANVSKSFNNFSVQAGPSLLFLIKNYRKNALSFTNNQDNTNLFFVNNLSTDHLKFLYGINISLKYRILEKTDVFINGQKMFNSSIDQEKNTGLMQWSLGLSYKIF